MLYMSYEYNVDIATFVGGRLKIMNCYQAIEIQLIQQNSSLDSLSRVFVSVRKGVIAVMIASLLAVEGVKEQK